MPSLQKKNNEALKKALSLTATELQRTIDELELYKRALYATFPMQEYKKSRPDLADFFKNNEKDLIEHFVHYGIEEMDLQHIASGNIAKSIIINYLRDVCPSLLQSTENSEKSNSFHSFSKTKGTNVEINNNDSHSIAKEKCLLHFASNSICTWIPKNGCSNLRFSIALANGFIDSKNDIGWIHNLHAPLIPTNKEILAADFSFVVLRNPFKRLLSFFLDKLCHTSLDPKDTSYQTAQQTFQIDDNTSFMDFVDLIYSIPDLISLDQHTKTQCDYLIYNHYKKYYQFEKYDIFCKSILSEIGLNIIDTRNINTIYTTKCLKFSQDFKANMPIRKIRSLMEQGLKPVPDEIYTNDMVRKVGTIYFADIILYHNLFKGDSKEMSKWMNRMIRDY